MTALVDKFLEPFSIQTLALQRRHGKNRKEAQKIS
jgi:hypothetical protein